MASDDRDPPDHAAPTDDDIRNRIVLALDGMRTQMQALTEFVADMNARLAGAETVPAVVDENQAAVERDRQMATAKEFVSHYYREAHSYSAVVIAGAYAAFFATLSLMAARFTDTELALAAVLMSVSLVTFVFWEVGNIIYISVKLARTKPGTLPSGPGRRYYVGWVAVLVTSIATALPAFGISIKVYLATLGVRVW
jgi:hypothetical protein